MTKTMLAMLLVVSYAIAVAAWPAQAADDSKVKAATEQLKSGAKEIGSGKVGTGIEDTAKGIGKTVEEGAKYTGEKLKEAGQSAKPEAKSAGNSFKDGLDSFGTSVKNFFTRLFGSK
jgi:hypothetical protein